METITTIGLDLAKSVFQGHGITQDGRIVVRKALRRSQVLDFFRRLEPCLVGLEACASARHWANAIGEFSHTVRTMPAAYVAAALASGGRCDIDPEAGLRGVKLPAWVVSLMARKPYKVAAVALANSENRPMSVRTALTIWAPLVKGGTYQAPAMMAAA